MMLPTISRVHARQVWDSRGRPSVEAEVSLATGQTGRAIAPAGASRGQREAIDLRDGGARQGGFGVARQAFDLVHAQLDLLGVMPRQPARGSNPELTRPRRPARARSARSD